MNRLIVLLRQNVVCWVKPLKRKVLLPFFILLEKFRICVDRWVTTIMKTA